MWYALLLSAGYASSLLCGRTKEVEVGSNVGAGAALALTLLRPQAATTSGPCQLKLNAPDAAAFTVRLIDVKVGFMICFYFGDMFCPVLGDMSLGIATRYK